jgi:hypothetical protein
LNTLKVPELSWQSKIEIRDDARIIHRWLDTPYGTLRFKLREQKRLGVTPLACPLTVEDNLDVVSWYAAQHLKGIPYLPELLGPTLEKFISYIIRSPILYRGNQGLILLFKLDLEFQNNR